MTQDASAHLVGAVKCHSLDRPCCSSFRDRRGHREREREIKRERERERGSKTREMRSFGCKKLKMSKSKVLYSSQDIIMTLEIVNGLQFKVT